MIIRVRDALLRGVEVGVGMLQGSGACGKLEELEAWAVEDVC